jgi:hypothetical protein
MIERIEGMPAGTIGLSASGKLTKDEYQNVLEPALKEGVESGELRMVFRLTDFDGLEANAWFEDAKTGFGAILHDHAAWRRFALVTDVDWVARAYRLFIWATPGEVKIFGLDELEDAKAWAAAE